MTLEFPPLPAALGQAARAAFGASVLPRAANPALVWGRFPRVFADSAPARSERRTEFLRAFVAEYAAAGPNRAPLLASMLERLDRIAPDAVDLRSTAPFATGLGQDHPVENGFAFDPLVGVPVLAGSGLKGLARAGARLLGADNGEVEAALGSPPPAWGEASAESKPAGVCFLGAWPTRWPKLAVELLNPHHTTWQQDQAMAPEQRSRLPDYTEEPVPVAFLVVATGARYRFWLRRTARAPDVDLAQVKQWLEAGFELLGAGAKTASGFGRMTVQTP